jgi:hypothetical protein
MAIAGVIRIDAMNSLHQAKPHVRRAFPSQRPASNTATVWGDATVQVPQVAFWQIYKRWCAIIAGFFVRY